MKLLPVCANCYRVRLRTGHWVRRFVGTMVDKAIVYAKGINLTHTVCPQCVGELYPEYGAILRKRYQETVG